MIDLDALLAPLPGEPAHGLDLRRPADHILLLNLRDAWRTARGREQRMDGGGELSDWLEVERQASHVLAEQSKDLEVAVWLCEALTRTEGFSGLAAGGALIAGLARQFWPVLYPSPPIDDPAIDADEARLQPLDQIADANGRLLPPIRRIELFRLDDETAFSFFDCQQSKAWTALRPEQREQRLARLTAEHRETLARSAAVRSWDEVVRAMRANGAVALGTTRRDIEAALENWGSAEQAIAQQAGEGRFSCGPMAALLTDVQRVVAELSPAEEPETEPPADAESAPSAAVPGGAVPAGARTILATRDDALRQLAEITAFFQRTEPHTPLAYTLGDAIRRARLSWPELLAEVVPDRAQRDLILQRLGIRSEPG